ncbi:nucleotidyltransferase family protein [Hwanghaeella sp.]|uniref:nucleotidyltransferase family protein n=1 Tax=Hwanghaeella sp. TaxID=2605943 RepID=UPI003CCBB717
MLASPWHADALRTLRDVGGKAVWIGAGFVRNAVWDDLHGRMPGRPVDIDVLIHEPGAGSEREGELEKSLHAAAPDKPWSVRNQARMHAKHGDDPYPDLAAAMRRWPETATAVAVRMDGDDGLWIVAPFGLSDLVRGILRPAEDSDRCRRAFDGRLTQKGWLSHWPGLAVEGPWPAAMGETKDNG